MDAETAGIWASKRKLGRVKLSIKKSEHIIAHGLHFIFKKDVMVFQIIIRSWNLISFLKKITFILYYCSILPILQIRNSGKIRIAFLDPFCEL